MPERGSALTISFEFFGSACLGIEPRGECCFLSCSVRHGVPDLKLGILYIDILSHFEAFLADTRGMRKEKGWHTRLFATA